VKREEEVRTPRRTRGRRRRSKEEEAENISSKKRGRGGKRPIRARGRTDLRCREKIVRKGEGTGKSFLISYRKKASVAEEEERLFSPEKGEGIFLRKSKKGAPAKRDE